MEQPRNLWDLLQKNVKKPIDKQAVQNIAKGVNPGDLNNDKKMLQLVRQLSAVAGIRLTPEKEQDIMNYLKENKFTGIESIFKLLNKNKGGR